MKQETFTHPSVWLAHRISYGETDAMGIVYYAEYFHIFERARDAIIRLSGMSYRLVEEKGFYLPVREARCRFRSPAHFDDVVWCRAGVSGCGHASITFEYELYDEEKKLLLVTGMTQHACTTAVGRPVRLPDWLRECVENFEDGREITL